MKQFVSAYIKMDCYVSKDIRQRADLDGLVVGDGEVVLAAFLRGQPQVAPVLAGNLVAQATQCLGQIRAGKVSW